MLVNKTGNGTLVLGGTGASNFNQAGATLDLDRGTLRFSANNAMSSAAAAGGLTISPEVATADTATVDLNGTTQTVNALTGTTNGTLVLDNTSSSAATFRFGANDSAIAFGGTTNGTVATAGSYTITDSGAGALSIVKLGNTSTTFGSHVVLTHQGTTSAEGGTFIINANLAGSVGLAASGGSNLVLNGGWTTASGNLSLSSTGASMLSLSGGITSPNLVNSVTVGAGSTLSLLDGVGSQFANLTTLNLGNTGSGTVTLNLNVGDLTTSGDNLQTDSFTLAIGGTLNLGNTITFNLTDAGLNPNESYVLLDSTAIGGGFTSGPLSLVNYILGTTPGGFTSMSLSTSTDNQIILNTGALITGSLYWRGLTDTTWNGNVNNWSDDKAGTIPSATTPGSGSDVIFAYDGVGAAALTTTLEQNFKVNSLTFESGTTTPASVTINPGTLATARLEVAPQVSTDGIEISTGGPAAVTIASNLRLGANQTWNVVDSGSTLTVSGALFGEKNVTKSGAGRVVLSGAADATFNPGKTATFTVTAGNLEVTNSAALGTTVNDNVASIVVSGGGYYYNNATAGTAATLPHNITLSGGALSGGGANHVYGGTVNVTAASTINLADSNGSNSATARSITLSGALTGSGALTIDGNNTASAGNQIGGTLLVNNAAGNWNGNLSFNRGTMTIAATASPTVQPGNITFNSFGRYIVQGVDGQTINRSGTLVYAAGAVGEFQLDNTTATQVTDFTVNQNGQVTLGAGGVGATMRVALVDDRAKLNLSGGVVLGGNSSISVSGAAPRVLTINSIISDGGSGYSLAINDDAGSWAQTNGIVQLSALNTFSGNLALGEGVLEFNTVTNAGGAASALGQGTAISIGGGNLRFIGSTDQTTNRPITTTASSTLSANGTGGAKITYTGAINQAANNTLTLAGTGEGVITGGITQPAGAATADLTVSGGTWTIQDANVSVADDFAVNAGSLTLKDMVLTLNDDVVVTTGTLNLNNTGILAATTPSGTSSGLHVRTGGTININANDVWDDAGTGGLDFINVGDSGAGAAATLNMNSFNITSPGLLVGGIATGLEGSVTGTGTITVTSTATDYSLGIRVYRGSVAANLAGVATILKQGLGEVTLSGNNSGLTATVGATRLDSGSLVLDFTTQNNQKISSVAALDLRGASMTLNGNNGAGSSQTVASTSLANASGANNITLNAGTGQEIVLNLGAITRAVGSSDGTLRIVLPAGTQSATNGVTTTTALTNGIVGGNAYLTVEDSVGTWFASKSGNNIVGLVSTAKNDVATWSTADNVTDQTTGYTGTFANVAINTLRFDAAVGSDVNLGNAGVLGITTGGILITDNVAGTPSIMNGTIFSGAQASNAPELIITHDGSTVFELGADLRTNSTLIKTGTGTLLLSGDNTTTGLTEVQNGILQVSGGNALGDSALVTLSDDKTTTLQLLDNETVGRISGGSATSGLETLATVNVGSFALTLNQGTASTYSGRFSGSGEIVKTGTAAFTFNGTDPTGLFTGTLRVNQGLMVLNGNVNQFAGISAINLTGSTSSLRFDNDQTTAVGSRFNDSATVTLNSTSGTTADSLGFYMRRTGGTTTGTEQVGQLILNSGANTVAAAGNATDRIARILFSNATPLVRNNFSTLLIVGQSLNATSGQRGRVSFSVDPGGSIGGGGAATSQTISIYPYMVGEDTGTTAPSGATHFGNSFMRYEGGTVNDMRALNLTTEYTLDEAGYNALGAGVTTNNVRFTSTPSGAVDSDTTAINSLVLDHATGLTLTGPAQGLQITSGAILSAGAGANVIGGYTSITTGTGNPYYLYVTNPSGTLTLASTVLGSAQPLVKSGAGTLVLGAINSVSSVYLNQGTLEISDLDNIGGNTGNLVFAGGTFRYGSSLTDDISTRTISFLAGGGTINTNGLDRTLANSVGSGIGGLTKAGGGNLTLNGTATYTGETVLSAGTITVGANNALGNGGNLTLAAGTTLDIGSRSLTHGLVTTSGASPAILGTGTISASTGFFLNHTGDTSIGAILGGAGGLLKAQTNIVTLSGASTYTGTTEIQAGTLVITSIANVGGGSSALGAPTTAENGVIRMGLTTAATTLNYTGAGHSSNRLIGMQGTTGGVTLDADGTGAFGIGGARMENAGAKTLTLRGSSDAALVNTIGAIQELGGVLTLNKTDANTWQINAASSYTGVTQIDNGTLRLGASNVLPTATTVRIGTGATAGTFDLNGFNQTIASLLVQNNSATLTSSLIIDTGNTLTVNGVVTIGVNTAAATTTLFSATGGGAFVNNNSGGTFQIGGATGGTNSNSVTADFSGLGSMTINLGATGTFRVGDANTGTSVDPSTLTLAPDTTVTAGTVRIGDGSGPGSLHTLVLGSGDNVFNANTFNVGSAGVNIRSSGAMNFGVSDTTGTLTLRGADGTSRVVFNMINTTGTTATDMTSTVNLSGHTADLLLSTMTMANRTQGLNAATATFSFDEGTLDVTTLNMASRTTAASSGNATATVNLGDGAAVGSPTTTIGTLNMAVNTSAGGAVVADLNVTGGTVNIGTGTGTAINMANAGTGRTVTSTIDLTGGTVNVTGNIIRTGGAGTENATITLDGAILDLNNNNIGTGTATIVLNAQSGTLRNVNQINGGGNLTKTGTGTLVLEGNNNYTGRTIISAGTVSISSEDNLGDNPGTFNAAQLEINGGSLTTTATMVIDDANRGITIGASGGGINVADTTDVTFASTNSFVLTGDLTKSGDGALYINSTSTGSGQVLVNAGTLGGTGTISGNTSVASGAVLTGGTVGTTGTLNFNGAVSMASGSTWLVDLVETTSGDSDRIIVAGLLSLGNSELDIALTGTFSGGSYIIATFGTLSGTFNNLDEGDYIGDYRISYGIETANSITLTAVPEPGTLSLLGLGLGGLLFRRLRRRRAAAQVDDEGRA